MSSNWHQVVPNEHNWLCEHSGCRGVAEFARQKNGRTDLACSEHAVPDQPWARAPEIVCRMCGWETDGSLARVNAPHCIGLQVTRVKLEWMGHAYDPCGSWKGETIDLCDSCFGKLMEFLKSQGVYTDWCEKAVTI